MRTLRDTFAKTRRLVGRRKRWRWWLLLLLALVVSVMEAIGAGLVYILIGLIATPDPGAVSLPLVSDISRFLPEVGPDTLRISVAILVAVFTMVRSAVVMVRAYVQERITNNVGVVIASDLLRGYLAMPYLLHTQRSSAELVRNTYDTTQQFVNQILRPLVTLAADLILALGLLVVLAITAPLATLLAGLVFLPSLWVLQAFVQPRLKQLGRRAQTARTGSISAVQQSLGAIRDIKLLDRGTDFAAAHASQRFTLARSQYLARTLKEAPRALIEATLVLTIVLIFVVAIVLGDEVDEILSALGLFAYAGLRLQPAMQRVVSALNELRFGAPIVDDLVADRQAMDSWLEEEAISRGSSISPTAEPFTESLSLEQVGFRYGADGPLVLNGIDLDIRPGEFIGICGPTGGGKSTLVDLLVGLLQPSVGRISVDGQTLGPRPRWWWSQIGVVSQEVFLVDASLRANIAFGVPGEEVDEHRLADCISRAQLSDVVGALPDGLDSVVGERGVRLSGGQRQRVAIARALYRDPPIIVFDEGTSALDSATEAAVVAALASLAAQRTLIAVAHRIDTIREADRMLMVADGRIVADGTHQELLRISPAFRSLIG